MASNQKALIALFILASLALVSAHDHHESYRHKQEGPEDFIEPEEGRESHEGESHEMRHKEHHEGESHEGESCEGESQEMRHRESHHDRKGDFPEGEEFRRPPRYNEHEMHIGRDEGEEGHHQRKWEGEAQVDADWNNEQDQMDKRPNMVESAFDAQFEVESVLEESEDFCFPCQCNSPYHCCTDLLNATCPNSLKDCKYIDSSCGEFTNCRSDSDCDLLEGTTCCMAVCATEPDCTCPFST